MIGTLRRIQEGFSKLKKPIWEHSSSFIDHIDHQNEWWRIKNGPKSETWSSILFRSLNFSGSCCSWEPCSPFLSWSPWTCVHHCTSYVSRVCRLCQLFPWNGCRKDLSSSPAFLDGACCANTREFIDVDVCHISCMFREALVDLCEVKRSTSSQASFSSPESILAFQVVIGPSHPSHSSHPRHPHRCWWPSPPRRPGTCDGLESHDCQCEIKHIISRRMLYASVLVSNVLCRVMMSLGVSVSSEMCGIQLVYCTWPQVKLRTHAGFLPCTCSTWLWLQNIWSLSLPCLPSLRPHIHIRIYIYIYYI